LNANNAPRILDLFFVGSRFRELVEDAAWAVL
jgi:hypothetical protein